MSLISRMEVTNYLTEGISAHRRVADWKPMLTGITLRMDGGKSALINITNGGGKTSLVELQLYLLSRDARLLKRIREKSAPKTRGYTHARIEFRTPPEDTYSAPSLLEIDPQNLPGETHVVGVVLNDDINDPPVFYSYSGTLEDSPCYLYDGQSITSVPDGDFAARTKALRGCKWNKFTSRREWEDHIRLFLPVEVIRRNVIYQLKGSDDKNASFFDFTPRGGESYDSAFFRSVVAPDLLSNLLSTFSEEDETAVEDTLLKSLSRIVDADREIVRKELRLAVRETGIALLSPIMDAGTAAQQLEEQRTILLRALRKDVAFLRHFGAQGSLSVVPGIPRNLPRMGDQDSRILTALKGMVITRDEGILLLDKALSEVSGVEVRVITQAADRKQIVGHTARSQVIDFACDFENVTSGSLKGGHYRRGYPKDSALAIPDVIDGISGAKTAGLKEVLAKAFEIAEAQIDTNPAARQVRHLQARAIQLEQECAAAVDSRKQIKRAMEQLQSQIKDRQDNQGAWDDFVKVGSILPVNIRSEPAKARIWLDEQQKLLGKEVSARSQRRGELKASWDIYQAVLEHHGLEGMHGAQLQYESLHFRHERIKNERIRLRTDIKEASDTNNKTLAKLPQLSKTFGAAAEVLKDFASRVDGLALFERLFGSVDASSIDPVNDLKEAGTAVKIKAGELRTATEESDKLHALKSQASPFHSIFGEDADPTRCNPTGELAKVNEGISAARESMASLMERKEAIEEFGEMQPGLTPDAWLSSADATLARLRKAAKQQEERQSDLQKEIDALEQMRSVEDGVFELAWTVLGQGGSTVQRLHEAILAIGLPVDACNDIMSAVSGMLSAPVFDTIEAMEKAAHELHAAGVAVPLILRAELVKAIEHGTQRIGETRLLGFIGGNTSRRVRILLDPQFAETERTRVKAEMQSCARETYRIAGELKHLDPAGDQYQLAVRAKNALASDALNKYDTFEREAAALETRIEPLKKQTTPQALEVLRCAREFIDKGAQARVDQLTDLIPQLQTAHTALVEAEVKANERASQASLNARDDALAYQRIGGAVAHQTASEQHQLLEDEMTVLQAQIGEAKERLEALLEQQGTCDQDAESFEQEQGPAEIERHRIAIAFAQDEESLGFMTNFEKDEKDLELRRQALISALSVSFERAEAFKVNQGKSDQSLHEDIASRERDDQEQEKIENASREKAETIRGAEIPNWVQLAKSVHDLAYEIGSRVARTSGIATQADDLDEGPAVPEAHRAYRQAHEISHTLQSSSLEAAGQVVQRVDELIQSIQEIDLQEGIRQHNDVDGKLRGARATYEKLNSEFCVRAEAAIGKPDAAFNALEIDQIKKATPRTMRNLLELFAQLQASLNKEREEARQAKRVAEETSADTIGQLSQLIVSAEDNLAILTKVMGRYPGGRFFFTTQINKGDAVKGIIDELKKDVERASRDLEGGSRSLRRGDETQLKSLLRDKLIACVFTNTEVKFVNGGIWSGKASHVSEKLSTGQKIALEFMWIVRQAEYEIERGLIELTSKQAAKSRAKANRVILVDGIFSTLSDRKIISEALNGLRDLGGNFQIIGFLHSPTWNNDYAVFPVYHVGKKLMNSAGDGLVSFMERGREPGTVGFFSTITQPSVANIPS